MDAHRLQVRLLGAFDVLVDGKPAGPAGERRRGLLALLALEANTVVPVDSLVTTMWGEDPPRSAVNVVQTYISTWRKVLDPVGRTSPDGRRLETVGSGYRLRLTADECDVLRLRDLLSSARTAAGHGDHGAAAAAFDQALGLWRGPTLADLSRLSFHDRVTRDLEDARLSAVEGSADAALRSGGDYAEVAAMLAAAHAAEPLRESLAELLMWALTGAGRQAEALDVWTQMRLRLREELGADPGPALAAMHDRVLAGDVSLQPRRQASLPSSSQADDPRRHPDVVARLVGSRLDSFIGRADDLVRAAELLRRHRLVTLTGPGGAGKSRLAAEILDREVATGGRGWFVELAALRDSGLVAATIAVGLDVHPSAGADPLGSLLTALGDTDGLLVLDNLEHLTGVHHLVDRLHRSTGRLRILATSREPLRIEGEHQLPVRPLEVPEAAGERGAPPDIDTLMTVSSVRLLVDRARAHDPGLVLDATNAHEMAEITRRLDGLPLAIEIAAPWLRLLTPAGLLERLREPLDVAGRRVDSPARHRTLRDTIDWSYRLLSPADQALLRALAVFAGSFTLQAAEAVCVHVSDVPVVDSLFDLVDRNFVQPFDTDAGGRRYRLLETIRAFAAEEAARSDDDAGRWSVAHADWYSDWAIQLAAHSEGPDSGDWLLSAVAEADNIRAAIATYRRLGRSDDRLQLVVDAMTLWFEAGHEAEGEAELAAALGDSGPEAPARAIGLTYWAWLRGTHHRSEAADAARQAVSLARRHDDPLVEAFGLQTLGDTTDDPAEADEASRAVFVAADRAEGLPVRYGPTAPDAVRCGASYNLAARLLYRSVPEALAWQQEALRRAELEGDRRITAVNAARLAMIHLLRGDPGNAEVLLRRARGLVSRRVTARWEDIVAFAEAQLAMHRGVGDESELLLRRVQRSAASGGRPLHVVLAGAALADLFTADDRRTEALAALAEAERTIGPSADSAHTARLAVRRARLSRLDGRPDEARTTVDTLADIPAIADAGALPPERVVWLLESASLHLTAGEAAAAATLLNDLAAAIVATGVHLSPWERGWHDLVAREVSAAGPQSV